MGEWGNRGVDMEQVGVYSVYSVQCRRNGGVGEWGYRGVDMEQLGVYSVYSVYSVQYIVYSVGGWGNRGMGVQGDSGTQEEKEIT